MVGQRSVLTGIGLLVLAQGLAGCGRSGSSAAPSAPSPVPQPTPIRLVVFTDPAAGFSTSDVRDAQEQIVRFNTADELIWTADGTRFPGYRASSNLNSIGADGICPSCTFQVRFGIKDGERRAYLTMDYNHYSTGSVVDLEVVDGKLVVTETNVGPPGTYTLSGLAFEVTPTGPAPVEGVTLQRLNFDQYASTDKNGFYSMPGLYAGITSIWAGKDGYQGGSRDVTINDNTRLDIQIVRR